MTRFYVLLLLAFFACKIDVKKQIKPVDINAIPSQLTKIDSYHIDTKQSLIYWQGATLGKTHNGSIFFNKGFFGIQNDSVIFANLEIDMHSIQNFDVTDEEKNAELIAHLKSSDFFDVEKFPFGRLKVQSSNYQMDSTGNITRNVILELKGISQDQVISYKKASTDDAFRITMSALKINRQLWNIHSKFTHPVSFAKDLMIQDTIILHAKIMALKK
ncbi:MAG: YceI family protein [Saprospiraceae bacterium]|nr:YceI family protein [Saprospiraceae bacterium]